MDDTMAWLVAERDRLQALYDLADPADPLAVEAAILRLRAAELDLERSIREARSYQAALRDMGRALSDIVAAQGGHRSGGSPV